MGLLNFLNKRPQVDTSSEQKSQTASAQARGIITSRESGTRTPDPSQRLLKPRIVGISEARPGTNPKDSNSTNSQFQLKPTGRNPKDSITYLKLDPIPGFGDHQRPKSRHNVEQLTPVSLNFPLPRRRSSAFVDILDAQGDIKPSNFKSRIQASGTRDYGEDVADRNMVETLPSPRSCAVYSSLSGSTLLYRPHGSVSTASSSKHVFKGQTELEYPRANSISAAGFNGRPSSRQTSIMSRPGSRGRVSPAAESFFEANELHDYRPQSKMSYGQISITGSRAPTPQQAPRTADGSYMRDESNTLYDDPRSASPPGVPRYKPRQYSLPGSVRSARENLNNSLLPPHFDRSRQMYQQRCKTPTSPNQLHSFRHRVDNDWSRFNRYAGDYLHPTKSTWENASSSASEYAPSFSFGSTGNLQIDDSEKQPSIRTFGRRGSISSYAPSDYSGQQLTGGRSVCTADTSIDIPHNSLFNEMKFMGGSSRNLRSRGGDSSIAPDRTGAEEDSGGESIFISPATPSEEQPPFSPLSPSHRYGGLSISSYDATSISDSDADSFCIEQRQTGRDGEALLFRAQGFGDDGKSLPGLFDGSESLAIPKWPEMPATSTDVSEMGDDESSVIGLAVTSPEPRQTSSRPFTQRERLLALGYDYDSDSDIETSLDSDEVPEDRTLQLLTALVRGRTSAAAGSLSTKGPLTDMKAIAKLRKDIKRRQRLDASPAGRRSKSSSSESGEVNTTTATTS
ncbi:uncharacterized protein TrAtP1_013177 [Trichoderma atroviride]|uniref:Uncharacterized protein n=1 Tax=Hypocrea atroviridis (strain ATCC 20476 / IMI 206040) TaxID=452589 RepID=G9NTN4_HYPAI|nr:uncharacterized protein TRIATDRAFT_40945 [Trichoderma atroviride IMI 206040]EHK46074.1 hypothetical protein TRIATDRAFT_40945 [Trichoderma atroviride IMI 206040]UKZ72235.1 hypothetical protein TrAtP1_013177 [Trichoderma atroviride]